MAQRSTTTVPARTLIVAGTNCSASFMSTTGGLSGGPASVKSRTAMCISQWPVLEPPPTSPCQMPQLVKRCHLPVAVAAGTSILIVASTVLGASIAHLGLLMQEGGVDAVPWNLVLYTVPGAMIGAQIGARLQGTISPKLMERSMAVLFAVIGALFLISAAA